MLQSRLLSEVAAIADSPFQYQRISLTVGYHSAYRSTSNYIDQTINDRLCRCLLVSKRYDEEELERWRFVDPDTMTLQMIEHDRGRSAIEQAMIMGA